MEVPPWGRRCSATSNLRMRFCRRDTCCVVMASLPTLRYNTRSLLPPKHHHAIGPRSDPRQSARRASHSFIALELTYDCLEQGREAPMEAMHDFDQRSEEHTSELQSLTNLVCRLLLE